MMYSFFFLSVFFLLSFYISCFGFHLDHASSPPLSIPGNVWRVDPRFGRFPAVPTLLNRPPTKCLAMTDERFPPY